MSGVELLMGIVLAGLAYGPEQLAMTAGKWSFPWLTPAAPLLAIWACRVWL